MSFTHVIYLRGVQIRVRLRWWFGPHVDNALKKCAIFYRWLFQLGAAQGLSGTAFKYLPNVSAGLVW